MKSIFYLLTLLAFQLNAQNCPTDPCTDHLILIDVDAVPGPDAFKGDIDNNSDCEDVNGDNCFKWKIFRSPTSTITGFSAEIGQGNGCNGEVDNIYIEIDGVCTDLGSSGSQNTVAFDFLVSDTIFIWLCDGSSGTVSICNFTVNDPALPVTISYFDVQEVSDGVSLEWETYSEINNHGFVVQRSLDLTTWQDVNFVEGSGDSYSLKTYSYVDTDMPFARAYYRLKQVDLDGEFSFSEMRVFTPKVKSSLAEAIEYGTCYNILGQKVEEKRGLVFISYKGESYKVFINH